MFNSLATVAFSKKTFHFRTPCILMVQVSKQSFGVAYVVNGTRFCAPQARKVTFISMDQFILPRRFQRGIARPRGGSRSAFCCGRTQGSRHGERTLRGYIYRCNFKALEGDVHQFFENLLWNHKCPCL